MSLELKYNRAPVCPTCRKGQSDFWEYNMSDGDVIELECGWCERLIRIACHVEITYSTEPIFGPGPDRDPDGLRHPDDPELRSGAS